MGFLTRLLSIGGKTRRKHANNDKNDKSKKNTSSLSNTRLHPIPQDQDAVVNRLLRSSSTHFSVLSETEYRSLPPIREFIPIYAHYNWCSIFQRILSIMSSANLLLYPVQRRQILILSQSIVVCFTHAQSFRTPTAVGTPHYPSLLIDGIRLRISLQETKIACQDSDKIHLYWAY